MKPFGCTVAKKSNKHNRPKSLLKCPLSWMTVILLSVYCAESFFFLPSAKCVKVP